MAALLDFEHIGGVFACGYCNRVSQRLFRCTTCTKVVNSCQNCVVHLHHAMPFHRVALWNHDTGCFQERSLSELGLVINVGHKNQYERCPSPRSPRGIVIIHSNGIHHSSVQFCDCSSAETDDLQLFASRLFSASIHIPQTAFSFAVLELFRHLHLEGKGSAYTFMNGLHRLTDDAGYRGIEVSFYLFVARLLNCILRTEFGSSGEFLDSGTICTLESSRVDTATALWLRPLLSLVRHALIPARISPTDGLMKFQ
jgi:hypothetical protein